MIPNVDLQRNAFRGLGGNPQLSLDALSKSTKEMLIHLAAGGDNFPNFGLFTEEMLIHLAAGGGKNQNSQHFTKGMLIHLAAGGDFSMF